MSAAQPALQRTWSSLTLGTRPLNGQVVSWPDEEREGAAMNSLKRRIASAGAHYFWNPIMRPFAGRRGAPSLLETVGRKSGLPRRTPVGNGLDGDTFWIIAEHGRHSDWVRNIVANPRVRVKVNGAWRSGAAYLMPKDDPIVR